jgi:hypothetical protein
MKQQPRLRGENLPYVITPPVKGLFRLDVALNGTRENPFHAFGLTQNPFPQLAKAELRHADSAINKLAAAPIPHDSYGEYISKVLDGWDQDFIDLCIGNFRPGEYVKFSVYIPGPDKP